MVVQKASSHKMLWAAKNYGGICELFHGENSLRSQKSCDIMTVIDEF
jgi:hypothetical protein